MPPRKSLGRIASGSSNPSLIPLNDDAQEKKGRLHSRKALHEKQINELQAAAATPPKKKGYRLDNDQNASPHSNPRTPRQGGGGADDDDDDDLVPGGTGISRIKAVPILANFEEWMKMATDNKINANNSWNFALIDYFHDMSLLKEGDGVNFQRASCTLDGCVKIYTSRVDSVATETGKLLSGLADSNSKKKDRDGEDGEESEEEVDEDGNVVKKKSKKRQRSSEATLAPSFASLQIKKLELEFAVDPLFKKASADFDEGGAKGLLLNHLMIDGQGRIVFDSSDDTNNESGDGIKPLRREDVSPDDEDGLAEDLGDVTETEDKEPAQAQEDEDVEIDIAALGAKFFPNLSILDEQDVCPSLKNFDLGNPSGALDLPFLHASDENEDDEEKQGASGDKSGMFIDDDAPPGFDDMTAIGDLDTVDVAFGEGGEAWARDAHIQPQMRLYNMDGDDAGVEGMDGMEDENGDFAVSLQLRNNDDQMHQDILGYFDQALQKNWAGPEHWRIRKIKDANKPEAATRQRKEKEPFEIDFASPLDHKLADAIFTQASANSVISLAKKDWRSKTRNLLPDDKHFSSTSLLNLFTKPRARMSRRTRFGRGSGFGQQDNTNIHAGDMDEAFWANKEPMQSTEGDDTVLPQGDYDANFFEDEMPGGLLDDDDDMEFSDARDHFSPGTDLGQTQGTGFTGLMGGLTTTGGFGTQLVSAATRRMRPDYVQYARVAKKVDVRRLKEELWNGLETLDRPSGEKSQLATPSQAAEEDEDATVKLNPVDQPPAGPPVGEGEPTLNFTKVMNDLTSVYPSKTMSDISTSYCFICLLHLANEKGLSIEKTPDLMELQIRKDLSAETIGEI